MSTKLKIIILSVIAVLVVALVIVLAFVLSPKEGITSITYKDYDKLIKEENSAIYYGKNSDKNEVKEFSETYGVEVSILNPEKLSKSEVKSLSLKEEYLYFYSKGKEVYNVNFASKNYKTISELMSKDLIKGNYIEVNLDEYKEIIKSDGYNLVFIGRETCSWCQNFKESIRTALEDNNFAIYYIDTDKFSENQYSELYETDSYLKEEEWGTPLTLIYKDGKRIDVINGYVESDALVETLKKNKVL